MSIYTKFLPQCKCYVEDDQLKKVFRKFILYFIYHIIVHCFLSFSSTGTYWFSYIQFFDFKLLNFSV